MWDSHGWGRVAAILNGLVAREWPTAEMTFEQRAEGRSVQAEGRAWVPEARGNLACAGKSDGPAGLEAVRKGGEWQKMWSATYQQDKSCQVCSLCEDMAFFSGGGGSVGGFGVPEKMT